MSIVILNGSPRKEGNTATLLKLVEAEFARKKIETKRINLYALDFKGCSHCDACKKFKDRPGCVLPDDFSPILEQIAQTSAIIIASPVYCWGVTGSVKAALDRFYALFKNGPGLLANKKIAGIFTCGGDYFDGMELCVTMLKHICEYAQANYVATLPAINCAEPDELLQREWLGQRIASFVANF
jgi:multimeric flavodoxin WrbA